MAPCGRNSLTAKINSWPTKVWAYLPTAVRSFLFYANHVAASYIALQYSTRLRNPHTHSKAKLSKCRAILKPSLRRNRTSDRKSKNRFLIKNSIFYIFFIFSPDDYKVNCWHVFTGTFADRFLGRVLFNSW